MKTSSLLQVLAAAHLSYAIDGLPRAFAQRGGIMLIGPPENFKTTLVLSLEKYSNALVCGDLNVKQLVKIRDQMSAGRYRTLVLPAYEKLYKRDADTASNLEGHISQLTEEGLAHASFEDHDVFVRKAFSLVVGALVEEEYRKHFARWKTVGFARRFLWSHFILDEEWVIKKSILEWNPLRLAGLDDLPGIPADRVPFMVTAKERTKIASYVSAQEGTATPFILALKIFNMLKWRYRNTPKPDERAMEIFSDFAESLTDEGARLTIDRANDNHKK